MPRTIKKTTKKLLELELLAMELRKLVIDIILEAKSGHPAGSLGTAEIFAALYFHIMSKNDKFVLSNGHICPILYATLYKKGIISKKDLWTFRKINSRLQGHPHYGTIPGIETTSGPLGQGLSQAAGMALVTKNRVFCMTGDGELDEGQIWEAAMFIPKYNLINLTWIIDRNNIQMDGLTEKVMPLENLREKLEAFNWYVIEIDGHNVEELINACKMADAVAQRPTAIIAYTIPGKGVDFMEYKVGWHGKPPDSKQAQEALEQLNTLGSKIGHYYE